MDLSSPLLIDDNSFFFIIKRNTAEFVVKKIMEWNLLQFNQNVIDKFLISQHVNVIFCYVGDMGVN